MLDNPPLLTIHRGHRRPDAALIDAFRGAQTSHLVDAMDGRGALDHRIKPMDPANAANMELVTEYTSTKHTLDQENERWMELSEALEALR